jgi:hypothetical protein
MKKIIAMTLIIGITFWGVGALLKTTKETIKADIENSLVIKKNALDAAFDHLVK